MSVGAVTSSDKVVTAPQKLPHRFLLLLITELVLILGYPFTDGTAIRAEMFRLFAVLVFSAALYAVLGRGRVTIVAFLLGVPLNRDPCRERHALLVATAGCRAHFGPLVPGICHRNIHLDSRFCTQRHRRYLGGRRCRLLAPWHYLWFDLWADRGREPQFLSRHRGTEQGIASVRIYLLQLCDVNHRGIWRHCSLGCACPLISHIGISHRNHVSRGIDWSAYWTAQQCAAPAHRPSDHLAWHNNPSSIFRYY